MKVLVLGANGQLGPHVVKALEGEHEMRLTDVNDLEGSPLDGTSHEYVKVDVSNLEQVVSAAQSMEAIVNLSVLRPHRQVAFDVNARGCVGSSRMPSPQRSTKRRRGCGTKSRSWKPHEVHRRIHKAQRRVAQR